MSSGVIRVLGIDPGSRVTGFGIIDSDGSKSAHVYSGCIKAGTGPLPERLRTIFDELSALLIQYSPHECAVEKVFVNRNVDSAMKLGHARGAAILAAATRDMPVFEFSATQIKQAIVGRGHADKQQVQHMVRVLLNLSEAPQADEADALGAALCHAHTRASNRTLEAAARLQAGAAR